MKDMDESQNRALRNRPTYEHTKEVLELVRSQEKDVNSNVLFDEVLLRKALTSRPNGPLPSIRVGPSGAEAREADEDFSEVQRWRLSEQRFLSGRDLSPRSSPGRGENTRLRRVSTTSCPDRFGQFAEHSDAKNRGRSSSDAPLLESRNRSRRSSMSTSPARRVTNRTNLPPLEQRQHLETPSCPVGAPSRSRKDLTLSPEDED